MTAFRPHAITNYVRNLIEIFLPRHCIICNQWLGINEEFLCPSCQVQLPVITFDSPFDNPIVRQFESLAPIKGGITFMKYIKGGESQRIFFKMKYNGRTDVCFRMGEVLATTHQDSSFFSDIDVIVPIPLSRQKQKVRGYNQAEHIALGISRITGIPVDSHVLFRLQDNLTQTRKRKNERKENVQNIFSVDNTDKLQGKHVLVVDDIITTGATLSSAIYRLTHDVPHIKVSVACIGLTSDM